MPGSTLEDECQCGSHLRLSMTDVSDNNLKAETILRVPKEFSCEAVTDFPRFIHNVGEHVV
jgi:hypothetical protein